MQSTNVCCIEHFARLMCFIEQRPKTGIYPIRRIHSEILRTHGRLDGPRPFDRAKTLVDRGRENGLWPVPARDTNCPHHADVGFLGDIVVARAQRCGDDRPIALLAWKSRQMEIMRGGFQRANKRSIPCHWRHRPGIHNRTIAELGNLGHRGLSLLYEGSAIHWGQYGWAPGRAVTPGAALETPYWKLVCPLYRCKSAPNCTHRFCQG